MKAIAFVDEFNKCFNEKFKMFSSHKSDDEYEYVSYTEFTEGINEVMEVIGKNNGLLLKKECQSQTDHRWSQTSGTIPL